MNANSTAMSFLLTIATFFAPTICQAQPRDSGPGGVVFLDRMEDLKHWTSNDDVALRLDKTYRKTGSACLHVRFQIDKNDPGAAWLARTNVGLKAVPQYLQLYLLFDRGQKFTWGEPRIRVILQDADGTAVMTFLAGTYEKDSPLFPKPDYYLWPKIRLPLDKFEPYWPGENGVLDGIETITFEVPHRVEEFMFDGPYEFRLDELAAVFPDAQESIDGWATRIARRVETLQKRLDAIAAPGTWRRYPTTTLRTIDLFRQYAPEEAKESKPVRAARQLEFLDTLCNRLGEQLTQAEKGQIPWPDAPPANCRNLKVRGGNFCDGDRPVYLTGFCGWPNEHEIQLMAELGLNGLSGECGPVHTRPTEDNRTPPENVLPAIRAAQKNNLAFDLLVHPHYVPDWVKQKYPDMQRSPLRVAFNRFLPWDVDSQGLRRMAAENLEVAISATKGFDNLVSYDLTNELWYLMLGDFDPKAFRAWLQKKYKTIDALNRAWGAKFADFDRVQYQSAQSACIADLYRYNQDRVTEFYRWLVAKAKSLDDTRLVYAKVHGAWRQLMGVDKVALSGIFDASGSDCFTRRDNPDENLVLDAWTTAMNTSLWRSLAPDKPIIDPEQHMLWYGHVVEEAYVPALLWWRAVLGLDANYVWVWGRTIENEEECISTQPWAFHALCQTALDFQRLGGVIAEFQAYRPDVLLIDAGAHTPQAYRLCAYTGAVFDLLPPEAVSEKPLSAYATIVIPTAPELGEDFRNLLSAVEAKGVTVIRLAENARLEDLVGRIVSKAKPIVKPQDGMVNLTVLDQAGRPMTFLLNLRPEPVRVEIAQPAKDKYAGALAGDKQVEGSHFDLPPLTPEIVRTR